MGYEVNGHNIGTLTAAAGYTSNQYHLAAINSTANQAVLGATLGQVVHGVIQNDPASGEAVDLRIFGVSKVRYGGTVAKGDALVCAASGEAVTQTLRDQYVIGYALEGGSNDEVGTMLITPAASAQVPSIISIPITLANITAAGDVVTTYTPGFAGRIVKMSFVVTTAVTTGSKAATLNAEIGTTNLTGGAIALTSANCTPLGAVIDGTAITAANTFTSTDTISIEAASVTAFAEGAGVLLIVLN